MQFCKMPCAPPRYTHISPQVWVPRCTVLREREQSNPKLDVCGGQSRLCFLSCILYVVESEADTHLRYLFKTKARES